MPRIKYLGLDMDSTVVPQIVAALRGLYSNLLTPTDTDDRVVQVVLQHIITEHLAAWAARNATPPIDQVIKDATDGALAQQETAEDGARTVAADIKPTALI